MHALPQRSAVLVLSTPTGEATRVGVAARGAEGVTAVTADPERGQVIVRYDPARVTAEQIRSAARDDGDSAADAGFWLSAWPRLANALPTAASLL
jgi:copper chaperone CopZ